ncbi:MAG TPA: hypothetical protein PLE09_04815 [Caldisericia bacterium]|nr:hypothetical protein [Caldisericia bacterium]
MMNFLFFVFFLSSGVWFGILAFSRAVYFRIMQSRTFFSVIVVILGVHVISIFYSQKIQFQMWHAGILLLSSILYALVMWIVRNEIFISGISEEEFRDDLVDFLKQKQIPFSFSDQSFLPFICSEEPPKIFYIYAIKTAFIRSKTKALTKEFQEHFFYCLQHQKKRAISYEKYLYAAVCFLLVFSALRFISF